MLKSRRHRTLSFRPPLLLTLMVLIFAAGMVTARLWWMPAAPGTSASPLTPVTATPVPATATPVATPTPTSPEIGDALETLYLDIAPDDFAKIEAKREEALDLWILLASDADFVPVTVRLGEGAALPADVRLKGDWADHLAYDKWSFRVEMKRDAYVDGMQVFSVHSPSMRTYLNEWLFHRNMREEDVLSVGYRFVRLVLNGSDKGIYALEEGFAKELLESQQRREGLIIRYAEDLLWTARAFYDDQVIPPGIERFYVIDDFETGRIARSPALSAQRDAAVGLLRGFWTGDLAAPEVFDLETMGRFLALSDLWSAPHGLIWHNLRYYYNPVTAQLEPISFDADPFSPELNFEQVGLSQSDFYNDPYLQAAYVRELWRISQPGYVEALQAKYGAQFSEYATALEPEFGADVLAPPWELLRRRQLLILQRLMPLQMVYASVLQVSEVVSPSSLRLSLGNLMDLPVEILGLEWGGQFVPISHRWLAQDSVEHVVSDVDALVLLPLPEDAPAMPYVHMDIPTKVVSPTVLAEGEATVHTRLWGLTQTVTQTIRPYDAEPLSAGVIPTYPSLDVVLDQHPYLALDKNEGFLVASPGVWTVTGNLILPESYGLRLPPGTTLRFGRENFLLASGPLYFEGTSDAPIILQPQQNQWLGVVVLDAGAPSFWQYTSVEATNAINQSGWLLTGGITFYRSPLHLSHSRILGTLAEDGLNVIRTSFEFVDSEFAHTVSDAFDADFAQGLIERCVFHDIGADAIDVSGASVQVRDVKAVNLGDKALSVGEASYLTAEHLEFENMDFGVVSKDLSQVLVSDMSIQDVRIAALAAYIKKPAYGPASIEAEQVAFIDVPAELQTLVQTGSWIDLEDQRIWGREMDIEALYEKWEK